MMENYGKSTQNLKIVRKTYKNSKSIKEILKILKRRDKL